MFFIRQGATHKVVIGPVVAVANGYVPVTSLTLSGADEAEAILHDNGTVVDISGYTFAAITTADGYYHLTLQSGISGTVGHMTVVINDDSLCLPVKAEFTVVEEAVYDAFYAASAPGLVGTAQTGDTYALANGASGFVAMKADTSATLADTNELQTDWANGGRLDLILDARAAETTLTAMKGATFDGATDSLEALRNRGDAAWTTATGFSTHSAADVWAVGTRALTDKDGFALSATGSAALTESYAADGAAPTLNQILYMMWSLMAEKAISGTTLTANQLDGTTPAMTFTLDDATTPSAITRSG